MSSNPKAPPPPTPGAAAPAPTSPNLSKSAPSLPSSVDPSLSSLRRKALLSFPLAEDDVAPNETSDVPPSPSPPLRPPFTPFFTIIEDATTSEHYHPNVHYIFSDDDDDDHDLLTDAALHALSNDPSFSASTEPQKQQAGKAVENSNHGSRQSSASLSTSTSKNNRIAVKDRYLIVDVSPSGDSIVSARSLTADWQALGAEVSKAPTWEAASAAEGAAKTGGLMLRIEGTEGFGFDGDRDGLEGEDGMGIGNGNERGMAELVDLFEKRMVLLRKVVESGERTVRLG
ncbi:MAG: hypothetical protein M1816_000376 [Peltula sp. TS41687]|nr:MAG: hypothetical protein M1816_000376 [Peltula sp. TS41687]